MWLASKYLYESFDPKNSLTIKDLSANFRKNSQTKFEESNYFLQYITKDLHCYATIELKTSQTTRAWTIGFIQACHEFHLQHNYGKSGISKWEFHPLKTQRQEIVSDCDGLQWPFYSTSALHHIKPGIISNQTFTLHLEDYFTPRTTWDISHGDYKFEPLNKIERRQSFIIWLVAIEHYNSIDNNSSSTSSSPNATSSSASSSTSLSPYFTSSLTKQNLLYKTGDKMHVLKSLQWDYNIDIQVNCSLPIGKRAKLMADQENKPIIHDQCVSIPYSALFPPCCNDAQSLIWYPNKKTIPCTLLSMPKEIIVDWSVWLNEMIPRGRKFILPQFNYDNIRQTKVANLKRISQKLLSL